MVYYIYWYIIVHSVCFQSTLNRQSGLIPEVSVREDLSDLPDDDHYGLQHQEEADVEVEEPPLLQVKKEVGEGHEEEYESGEGGEEDGQLDHQGRGLLLGEDSRSAGGGLDHGEVSVGKH